MNNLPTIGLSMIVKNEEKVILRLLKTIYPIIDHYTVVDTGSTDKTKAIIKQFFAGKKISGEIYDHKWVNYEDARNFALKKSKDKTDFSFQINASNTFNMPVGFDIENLRHELSKGDIGMLQANNVGGSMYAVRAFWRNSKSFRYFGATHEVLLCDEPAIEKNISNVSVTFHSDGKTWEQGKKKFLRNIKMLTDYIEKNGLEPRHVFYLAESYKDAGEKKKAIEWYEKRLELGGWIEEMYYSCLMIAGLKWELNYPIYEIADEYMRCGEIDTMRAEHLYHLKRMYEQNNRPQCAIKIGELLVKYENPYPQRILFLNPEAYNHDTSISSP